MGSVNIFASCATFTTTFVALLLVLATCFLSEKGSSLKKGLWFLFAGLVVDFIAVWIEYESLQVASVGGSITSLVYLELFFFIIVMILLAIAASQILVNTVPDLQVIGGIALLSFVCISYYIYVSPDGNMVSNMRNIFPMAGFAYLAAAFWSQLRRRHAYGYILAAITTSLVSLFLFTKLIKPGWGVSEIWYVPTIFYITLSISILLIRINTQSKKLDDATAEINKNNSRLQTIVKSSPFPIIISKLSDDKIIMANNNAIKLFGLLPQELDRHRLRDFFVDVDNRRLLTERLEQEKEVQDFEVLVKTPSGDTPFWLLASANVIDYNNDVALYSAFQNITSRKNKEMLLKNQAIRDPLTSLYNRRYFEEEVYERINAAKAANEPFSVLMLDADHFKKVNDTYGHKTGDKVLIELASTTEKALREEDIVARYGGEEFVVFLSMVNAEKAFVVSERLRESISSLVVYSDEGKEVRFTVSIGISSSEVSDNVDILIKTADEALYRAKQSGRNRSIIFQKKDLQNFAIEENIEKRNTQLHPIFAKEDNAEISLLDGIPSNQILEEDVEIEEQFSIPGVDAEDMK